MSALVMGTEAHPGLTVSSLLAPSAARPRPHHPQLLSRTGLGIQAVPTEKGARKVLASLHCNQPCARTEQLLCWIYQNAFYLQK